MVRRVTSAFQRLMSVHWAMANCYLLLFLTGVVMSRLPRELGIRNPLYDVHKSIGALTLALLVWRIVVLLQVWWKKYVRRLLRFTGKWLQKTGLHALLYGFTVVVPLSGFFFSNSFKSNNVRFFGVFLPDIFPENSALVEAGRSAHVWLAYIFLAFVLLHMADQRKVLKANWSRFKKHAASRFTPVSD